MKTFECTLWVIFFLFVILIPVSLFLFLSLSFLDCCCGFRPWASNISDRVKIVDKNFSCINIRSPTPWRISECIFLFFILPSLISLCVCLCAEPLLHSCLFPLFYWVTSLDRSTTVVLTEQDCLQESGLWERITAGPEESRGGGAQRMCVFEWELGAGGIKPPTLHPQDKWHLHWD